MQVPSALGARRSPISSFYSVTRPIEVCTYAWLHMCTFEAPLSLASRLPCPDSRLPKRPSGLMLRHKVSDGFEQHILLRSPQVYPELLE